MPLQLYSTGDIAKRLGLSRETIRNYIQKHKIVVCAVYQNKSLFSLEEIHRLEQNLEKENKQNGK